jgi:hypothetical protein
LPEIKQCGLHFIPRSGRGSLSASVGGRAAAEVSAMVQLMSVKWTLDDPLQKRIPFSTSRVAGMASGCISPPKPNSQFALDGTEVVKPACLREAIGNPNNTRKAR